MEDRYDDPESKTNGEFDVVTLDPKGYIFYEVKFRRDIVTRGLIAKEIEQVRRSGLQAYRYGFFSRSGFEKGLEDEQLILIPLHQLYQ